MIEIFGEIPEAVARDLFARLDRTSCNTKLTVREKAMLQAHGIDYPFICRIYHEVWLHVGVSGDAVWLLPSGKLAKPTSTQRTDELRKQVREITAEEGGKMGSHRPGGEW